MGGKMNTGDAQTFVQQMREDKDFRKSLKGINDKAKLWEHIKNNGFKFNECDLVKAMAACMEELENM